jgi:hypothetical protein
LAACNAHCAAAQPLEVLDLRSHTLYAAVLLAQVVHENLARRDEPHAARPTLEQRRAELFLQIHDSSVHGRRHDVEVIGGLADRSGARDLVHIPHDTQVLHR